MLAQRLRQQITLSCGRNIGFAEYGNPGGRPLFFLHGTPSSRLEVGMWDGLCEKNDIRMVAPDRPGFGLSSFVDNRKIADYPQDIAALAKHLGWTRFNVLGGSGGAPYVLACARYLPQESLGQVGVVAGSGPPEAGSNGLSLLARFAAALWKFPRVMNWLLDHSDYKGIYEAEPEKVEKIIRKSLAWLDKTDREACEHDFEWIAATIKESYAQGNWGPSWELYLMTQPWGFDIKDIRLKNIRLWCGTCDTNTPIEMSRYMADHLPEAHLVEMNGLTHFSIFLKEHMKGILESFLPISETRKAL